MPKGKKGSSFERDICRTISLWWSNGRHDDMFWRSATSGARATTRRKVGKKTRGHNGDIAATDSDGERLMDCITFELKRGYASSTFQDMLDAHDHAAEQVWESWIAQAMEAWSASGSFAWALVVRRDQRQALICIPQFLYRELKPLGALQDETKPKVVMSVPGRKNKKPNLVFITTLKYFLEDVEPCHLLQLNT